MGEKGKIMEYGLLTLRLRFRLIIALLVCGLAGCGSGESVLPDAVPDAGDPVTLTFDMYSAVLTRADGAGTTSTTEDMAVGKTFRIYAFTAGAVKLGTPLDSRVYTVQESETTPGSLGKATGNLTLYRGTYDLYLVSYNSSTEVPELSADGSFTVGNGRDFMYTKMEGIVVQPDKTGENTMLVSLPRPFTRMGACVVTTVQTKNGTQPVPVSSLKANWIRIKGLAETLTYKLGSTAWEPASGYNSSFAFDKFTREKVSEPWISEAQVVLPVDGSQMLDFEVNLTVGYNEGEDSYTGSFPASIQKVLLPGMTYQFDFSLTFYGVLKPSDLTLAVKEYDTVELSSDGLGGD